MVASPVVVAVLAHGLLIAFASREQGSKTSWQAARSAADNTRQLVQLSRAAVILQPRAAATLSAVPPKPGKAPPAPTLTPPPKERPKPEKAQGVVGAKAAVVAKSDQAGCGTRPPHRAQPVSFPKMAALWSLAPFPEGKADDLPDLPGLAKGAELRLLPMAVFEGLTPRELDRLLVPGSEHQYQLWVRGDQVWAARMALPQPSSLKP